jgi:hypothetical protein
MPAKPPPSLERLRELFSYDPETGQFTRLVRAGGQVAGKIAGGVDPINGYVRICVDYVLYPAHRLAIYMGTGKWPEDLGNHVNRVKHDNRLLNLRSATVIDSNRNSGTAPRADSRSGFRGVSWFASRGMWRATITVNKRQVHLGYFTDPAAAHAAYVRAKIKYHGAISAS